MKISKKTTALIIGLAICLGSANLVGSINANSNSENSQIPLETMLDNAKEFQVKKKLLSLFKKHYYILIDGVIVGEVTGKVMPIFGETLTMSDNNGNIIKTEHQVKRFGPTYNKLFNLSLDRLAVINDSQGNVSGYIGEEKLKNIFNIEQFLNVKYFYNSEYKKIGKAKLDFPILCKDYKIFDNDGNVDYTVDGNIFSFTSKAMITVHDDSEISQEDAIFYTIIENSILESGDSSSSESSSKSKSKK